MVEVTLRVRLFFIHRAEVVGYKSDTNYTEMDGFVRYGFTRTQALDRVLNVFCGPQYFPDAKDKPVRIINDMNR